MCIQIDPWISAKELELLNKQSETANYAKFVK